MTKCKNGDEKQIILFLTAFFYATYTTLIRGHGLIHRLDITSTRVFIFFFFFSLIANLAKDVTGTSSTLETAPVAEKATETVSEAIRTASNLVPSPLKSLFSFPTGKE